MSDGLEQAQQGVEHAHAAAEGHAEHSDAGARRIAVLISVLAAALALGEMAGPLLLEGQKVIPRRPEQLGYGFRFPTAEAALRDVLR